jgi:hypothetical protein
MSKRNQAGGGSTSRVVREVPIRTGTGSREMRPRAVSQIGQSLGNHVTETSRKTSPVEAMRGRPMPSTFGNAKALDVGKGGPGIGRDGPGADKPIFPGFK